MKKISILILAIMSLFSINAQNSDKAKKLLNEVSGKVKSYDNMVLDFKS